MAGLVIIGLVSDKYPGFCKCLRFLKTFLNSAGHQNLPALSASNLWRIMVMETTIKSISKLLITPTL